jgi:outer membrane receptor protein involved in Fe transport
MIHALAMRGFINAPISLDPPVAIYIDGIPINDFFSYTQTPLFDVDQIEVVKGPQSSLCGCLRDPEDRVL